MKSKKLLAQIAAFSLVFGMTGVVSSWADDIVLGGEPGTNNETGLVKNEDGSFTVKDKDVKGVWLQNGSKLTANQVNFINGGVGNSEISVDNRSTLIVNRGSIDSAQDAFNVNDGSKAEVNNAKVTTGAWANNAAITLKNSTTSGNWLYAGNAFPENKDDKGPVKEGLPVGSITIDGGTASVKNVLVQNKGQFNVTNGALLDVTKDTSAIDSKIEQSATGITKGGEIVVRAWGPNTAQAEKGNSDTDPVNKLDQVSTLAVNGATVQANKLTVEGKEAKKLNYSENAAFTAKNNTTVVLDSAVLNRAKFYAENSQISIGDLHADNSQFLANNGTKAEIQKMTMDNGSVLGVGSYGKVADVTVHQLDMKGNSTIAFENGQLNSDQINMDKSTIDIAGVGTLIANKMTLNNATLSLSGIQNNMDTRALIQPVDVTQNGVTVEVKDTLAMNGGKLQVNDGSNLTTNQMKLTNGSMVTVDGTNSSFTIKGTDNTVSGGSKIGLNGDAELNLKDLTLQDGGELYANWRSTVNADTISVEDGAKFQGVGRSTINVNNLRIGSNPGRIRVRGTFEGRVTDLNGNSLSKQQVKERFLLPTGDKTSLEFQDPEIDHTLVLHMNADGVLTMQGKDFSQADTGNTRTYIMASWSANGDYNAEGHNIKNVNSLSANRLVINGTDITDSLGGAVDMSGKADTSLGNLTEEGRKVIRNTMKGELDTKADATKVTEELAKKADTSYVDEKVKDKVNTSDFTVIKDKVDAHETALAGKADKSYVDAAVEKATEGVATDANVANKADKNLSNLSDAGKTVIKNTMMEELAGKADTNLTNLSEAGKEAIKNTVKADLMGKADTSYVDEKVKDKVNTSDFTAIKDKVDAHETALADKADTNLTNLSEAGKEAIKNTVKADLMGKADTSYVDEKVKDKVNTSDFTAIKDKVDAHETALADKADKSYVDAAVKKATEGVATDANVANKADKDLANLSEAGKNVIKETMRDDLAVKADKTYVDGALGTKADKKDLSDLSAKVDVKADKTYVDGALGTKADKKDLSDLSAKVDGKADKTYVDGALATKADKKDLSDLGAKVDGKADKDASNIDAAAYTNKLNTGKVEDGNTSLVSGGAVWNAIKDVKNNTGAGWVKVNGDTVAIASDAGATKVSVAGLKGDRVLTGVKTDEKDASSAANVGYVNSTAISLTDSMNAMNNKLSDDIKNAGAVGAALAGLHHLDYDPDNKLDVAVAAGNYRGKSATAMGLFYQPNEMMMVSAGATIGADDNAYNVGLSFKVGKGQTGLTTSKAAMSQEIKELKAAKEESDQKMAAQDEEIRALKEQVAMLVKEMKLSNTVEKDMKK